MKQNEWMNISDLMSVLMMVFLLISISYMLKLEINAKKMKVEKEKITYINSKINESLKKEFKEKLKKWNAKISSNNSIIFENSNFIFNSGSYKLKKKFKIILSEFFPDFIDVLSSDYSDSIEFIEINGHSSTEWSAENDEIKKYLMNLSLSQNRAYEVLKHSLSTIKKSSSKWVIKRLRSRGASSSNPISTSKKKEDKRLSRRVEFKVILKNKHRVVQ